MTDAVFGLNPHLRRPAAGGCPHGECDGSGYVLDEHTDEARPCRCRPARVAAARSASLARTIPERFQHVGFDRFPVTEMDQVIVREVRRYCDLVDRRLDEGRGVFFYGTTGTGKTTLAMLIAQYAMRIHRTVAIYDAPRLLRRIHSSYKAEQADDPMPALEAVELLVLDDMAVATQNEWVLEQFYSVINRRYEANRSIVVTADVEDPDDLEKHIGRRAASRLLETCLVIPMFGPDHRRLNAGEEERRAG